MCIEAQIDPVLFTHFQQNKGVLCVKIGRASLKIGEVEPL